MKIVVVNRAKGLVPDLPGACIVKITENPLEIVSGKGLEEKLIAQRSSEQTGVKEMIRRICDPSRPDEFKYFVEINNDLPQEFTMKIAIVTDSGVISEPIAIVEKGLSFNYTSGKKLRLMGTTLCSPQDVQRMKDILEIGRFVAYEIP